VLSEWDRSDPERPRRVRYLDGCQSGGSISQAPVLTISPDGQRLAAGDIETGYTSEGVCVWNTVTGKKVQTHSGLIGGFASNSRTLPFGFGDSTVLWDARTGRVENTVANTGGSALAVVSPDGGRLAVAVSDHGTGAVSVYDLRTHQRIGQPLTLHGGRAEPIGFLPDGRLVTGDANEAAIWTIGTDLPPLGVRLATGNDPIADASNGLQSPSFLSPSGTVLVVGDSKVAVVHDPSTGQARGPILGGAVRGPVAESPDGHFLVGERATGEGFGIWDLGSGQLVSRLTGAAGAVWDPPLWSHSLIAIDVGGVVELWHVADPRHPSGPERIGGGIGTVGQMAFTPDGRRLVAETTDSTISLLDVATGRVEWTRTVREGASGDIALSPDGATIAFSYYVGDTGYVQLLNTATGTPRTATVLSTTGGFGWVYGGRWLIVSEYLGAAQAQLYDASTLEPIGTPFPTSAVRPENPPIDPMAVNGPGTMFAETTSADPILWHVDPAHWLTIACTIAGRNLTSAEWHHYLPQRTYQRTCPQFPG
jgi:WD40 repeat protein